MASLKIGVKVNTEKETAELCLKMVEMYVNRSGDNVYATKQDDGTLKFEFESECFIKKRNEQAFEVLNSCTSCNECVTKNNCDIATGIGGIVRYNCPYFVKGN